MSDHKNQHVPVAVFINNDALSEVIPVAARKRKPHEVSTWVVFCYIEVFSMLGVGSEMLVADEDTGIFDVGSPFCGTNDVRISLGVGIHVVRLDVHAVGEDR
ncbi:MAG: hypothetical protein VXX90_04540 [Candidatus Thermoplasmatota archaeon]|nr:hypothetical protein [Candidatus Thermoplasmatota archaeon]